MLKDLQHDYGIRWYNMRDLNQLYAKNGMKKTFINFFKSTVFKEAKQFLLDEEVPLEEILQRTRPYRGQAATCMAHEIVALAFIQWDDGKKFNKMLLRMIS